MHIAIVTNRFIIGEGQGRVNVEIAHAAAKAGHTVTCLASSVTDRLLDEPAVHWARMPDANAPAAIIGNQRFARATTRWLTDHDHTVDLVVGNGFNTWAPVDVNIVHFVHSAWRESPVHDSRVRPGLYGLYQWMYSSVNAWLERRILPRARHIVAVSDKVREELVGIGLAPDSISVIHNGVDVGEFTPQSTTSTDADLGLNGPIALFVGDIQTPRKGLDATLKALQSVPEVHLAIAGDTEGSPYPALAEELGVADRAHFLGFRSDIPALMRAADLFVFPSRYEACSLVLLEAMGAGLPIITASTAGGAELVTSEAGIVLEDPDDVSRLTAALGQLSTDTDRLAAMGAAARGIAENHRWSRVAQTYLDLFETLSTSTANLPATAPVLP